MGTSTGYELPTSGNWPSLKTGVTQMGKQGWASSGELGSLMRGYTEAQGGSSGAASQMASAVRAGAKLGGVLAGIGNVGLSQSLLENGLEILVGRPASEVLHGLLDYVVGPGSTIELDLARQALFDLLEQLFGGTDDYDALTVGFREVIHRDGIGKILRQYFSLCILHRFRFHFAERLLKASSGMHAFKKLLRDISEYITSRLNVLTYDRDLARIDWRGAEGNRLSQSILASAWDIFGGG